MLSRTLALAEGVRCAALLLRIITSGRVHGDGAGWVQATDQYLAIGLGYSAELQAKLLDLLVADKLIEVEFRGRVRYLRVDLSAIERLALPASR
jgi:hypothetical protein